MFTNTREEFGSGKPCSVKRGCFRRACVLESCLGLNERLINTVGTMTRREEGGVKGADARQRILDAAVVLFARQGFDRTGMRALAEKAGVNLAMINYFYGSKKRLLTEILDIFFAGYLEIARDELAATGELSARVRRFVRRAIAFFASHRDFMLVAISELHHDDPEIIGHKAAWARQMLEVMEESFAPSPAAAEEMHLSPKLMAPLLTSMMASRFLFSPVLDRVDRDPGDMVELERYSEIIAGIVLHGITGRVARGVDA